MTSKSLIVLFVALVALSSAQTPQQNLQSFFYGLYSNLSLPTPGAITNCLNANNFFQFLQDLYFRSVTLQNGNLTGFNYYNARMEQDLLTLAPQLPCVFTTSDFANLANSIGLGTYVYGYYPNLTTFIDAYPVQISYYLYTVLTDFTQNYFYAGGSYLGPFMRNLPNLLSLSSNNFAAFMIGVFTSQNVSAQTALNCFSAPLLGAAQNFYVNWFNAVSNTNLIGVYNTTSQYLSVTGYAYYTTAGAFFNCLASSTSNAQFKAAVGFGLDFYTNGNPFRTSLGTFLGSGPVDASIYQNQLRAAAFYFANNQPRLAGEALGELLALV